MRSSSLAMVGALGLLLITVAGCRIEAHSQTQFEDKSQPAKTASRDWNGEAININNAGINPLGGLGGVEVKVSSTATRVSVEAVFAATADDDKETDAQASIRDAIGTLQITESAGEFKVNCGHGAAHGTSNVAASGCKIIRVTIPAGSAQLAHNLTVSAGSGSIRVGLADAGDAAPFVKNLLVDNGGLSEVDLRVRPVKDAKLVVTGEDAVKVALPSDFSARSVIFTVDESEPAKAAARISSDFTGMTSNSPYPVAGATADAAESLNVQSKGPFDSDTLRITKF